MAKPGGEPGDAAVCVAVAFGAGAVTLAAGVGTLAGAQHGLGEGLKKRTAIG